MYCTVQPHLCLASSCVCIYSIFSYGHSTVYIYSYVYNTVGYVKVYADSVLMVAEVWVKLVVFVKYRAKMDK